MLGTVLRNLVSACLTQCPHVRDALPCWSASPSPYRLPFVPYHCDIRGRHADGVRRSKWGESGLLEERACDEMSRSLRLQIVGGTAAVCFAHSAGRIKRILGQCRKTIAVLSCPNDHLIVILATSSGTTKDSELISKQARPCSRSKHGLIITPT
jgi:hypothetical protein